MLANLVHAALWFPFPPRGGASCRSWVVDAETLEWLSYRMSRCRSSPASVGRTTLTSACRSVSEEKHFILPVRYIHFQCIMSMLKKYRSCPIAGPLMGRRKYVLSYRRCHPVKFSKCPCRPVNFNKCLYPMYLYTSKSPCRMSLISIAHIAFYQKDQRL